MKRKLFANYTRRSEFFHNLYVPKEPPSGGEFIYIKMHKAASSTVIATLLAHMHQEQGREVPAIDHGVLHGARDTYFRAPQSVGAVGALQRFADPNIFCFTLIRDPYRRAVSAWADKIAIRGPHARRYRKTVDGRWPDRPTLAQFLDAIAQDEAVLNSDHHWRPQVQEGAFNTLKYDFVGDVGRLKPSLSVITERLFGTAKPTIIDTRSQLGHQTSSRELLADLTAADRKNIERAYGDDIALFEKVTAKLDTNARFAA